MAILLKCVDGIGYSYEYEVYFFGVEKQKEIFGDDCGCGLEQNLNLLYVYYTCLFILVVLQVSNHLQGCLVDRIVQQLLVYQLLHLTDRLHHVGVQLNHLAIKLRKDEIGAKTLASTRRSSNHEKLIAFLLLFEADLEKSFYLLDFSLSKLKFGGYMGTIQHV